MDQRSKRRIAIACQGGGSHAAFTAGVLIKILGEVKNKGSYEIVGLSGTSGGAICAFLTWHALQRENGEQEAIRLLEEFWRKDNSVRWPQEEWFANTLLQSTMSLFEDTTGMPPTNPLPHTGNLSIHSASSLSRLLAGAARLCTEEEGK
jgi:NTE family protein